MVRNTRKAAKEALKQLQKAGTAEDAVKQAEEKLQKLTDQQISRIDELAAQKEAAVMEV